MLRAHCIVFLSFILLLGSGCSIIEKDEEEPRDFMAEILMHANTFEREAMQRGVDVGELMARVRFEIKEEIIFEGQSLCGFALWYQDPSSDDAAISITVDDRCWISRPVEDNEALIFHELGHAVLGRDHRDELLPNNSRSSIMVSTNLAGLYVGNAKNRRAYYVDELFDLEAPVPDWAQQ